MLKDDLARKGKTFDRHGLLALRNPFLREGERQGFLRAQSIRADSRLPYLRSGMLRATRRGGGRLGLRFLRGFRRAGAVEGDRLAKERLEGGRVDCFSLVDVDSAARVSLEARVEEMGRIL
jgi:hypothetical protein